MTTGSRLPSSRRSRVIPPDLVDFVRALNDAGAKFLIVGGHAVGFHGHPRATKDLDVWIGDDPNNRAAAGAALQAFGAPRMIFEGLQSAKPDEFVRFGIPPACIDILQRIPGLDDFEQAYGRRVTIEENDITFPVIGRDDLLRAKRAAGRQVDLQDVVSLEKVGARETGRFT